MKKIILTISILFLASFVQVQGQNQKDEQQSFIDTSFGLGVSYFSEDVMEASNIALQLNFSISNIYLDLSSNFASGKGTELDFQSTETTQATKKLILLFNIGYALQYNKLSIIPVMGYGRTMDIYEDPIAFDTYYYADPESNFNVGAKVSYDFFGNAGLTAGIGTFEKFNIAMWFGF